MERLQHIYRVPTAIHAHRPDVPERCMPKTITPGLYGVRNNDSVGFTVGSAVGTVLSCAFSVGFDFSYCIGACTSKESREACSGIVLMEDSKRIYPINTHIDVIKKYIVLFISTIQL